MSFTKKDRNVPPNLGIDSSKRPDNVANGRFARVIADALHRDFGGTHGAVKTVVNLTKANERAVKNWFMAKNGPSGRHLVDLMRGSEEVLEIVLRLSGRHELVVAKKFADSRQVLIHMLRLVDDMQREAGTDTDTGVVEGHAIDVLLDQRLFELDADKFDAFASALDNPSPAGPALKSLMKRRPLWQK
jgi:Protein of unknown function (DUF1778)